MLILPQNFQSKESDGRSSQINISSSQVHTSVRGLIQPQKHDKQTVYHKPDMAIKQKYEMNSPGKKLPKNYSKYQCMLPLQGTRHSRNKFKP